MNKQEILDSAQHDNKGMDIADLEAQHKGAYFAYFIGMILIIVFDIVEGAVHHQILYGANVVLFAMPFTAFLVKFIHLKKKHELIVAICYGVGLLTFLVLYILQLIGVMPR